MFNATQTSLSNQHEEMVQNVMRYLTAIKNQEKFVTWKTKIKKLIKISFFWNMMPCGMVT